MNESPTPRPIVVGIDGSKAAIRAALWAVDEAVSRDVPVRLLYAIEHSDTVAADSEAAARELATAETAVRRALTAIEATGQPIKIEAEIVQGPPIRSLIGASAFAAMVCVGAVGLRQFRPVRVGDTAAALALSAQCPVAIIREPHNQPRRPVPRIVVDVDKSPDNGVLLGVAMEEARLRDATVEAIICRRIDRVGRHGGRGRGISPGTRRPRSPAGPLETPLSASRGGVGGGRQHLHGVSGLQLPNGAAGDCGRPQP